MKAMRGFSFVELMMTLAIMGTLVLVCVPMAEIVVQRSRERDLRSALIQIREALDAYKRAADEGRIELRPGDSGYPPSLDALVTGVPDQRSPTRRPMYFLRSLPGDPLAAVEAGNAGAWGLRSYESSADAPQAGADVFDVYSRSLKAGLNGVPYRQW
jgi:general secretion pathway protein G